MFEITDLFWGYPVRLDILGYISDAVAAKERVRVLGLVCVGK